MRPRVFVDGRAGTVGLQIIDRLASRGDIELLWLDDHERKDQTRRTALLNEADVAILCLADDVAREAVAAIESSTVRVIDASTAHRTTGGWVYGFPEYASGHSAQIAAAARVTNPGCYAIAAVAMLAPLVRAGLLPTDLPMTINGVSGYSGGGRLLIDEFEAGGNAAAAPEFYLYSLDFAQKHIPEIERYSHLTSRPLFVPSVGRFRQGMIVSVPLQLSSLPVTTKSGELRDALSDHYSEGGTNRSVRVATAEESAASAHRLDAQSLNGTDQLEIHLFSNEQGDQAVLCGVLDNLGKGAAGQAVQNLDLMLGITAE